MRSSSSSSLLQVPCYVMHKQHIHLPPPAPKSTQKIVSTLETAPYLVVLRIISGIQSDELPCDSFLLDHQTQHPSVTKYTGGGSQEDLFPFFFSQKNQGKQKEYKSPENLIIYQQADETTPPIPGEWEKRTRGLTF